MYLYYDLATSLFSQYHLSTTVKCEFEKPSVRCHKFQQKYKKYRQIHPVGKLPVQNKQQKYQTKLRNLFKVNNKKSGWR